MVRINEAEKKLIIQFCHTERIKSAVLNMMQIFLKYHDHTDHEKEDPDGKTVVSWFLNVLHNDVARAANISQSKDLIDAQNLVSQVIMKTTGPPPNFQNILETLRETLTKITTEASKVAKELKF